MPYWRRELWLLLLLAAGLGVGFGVRQFRSGFPDLAGRLESFDAEPETTAPAPSPVPARPPKLSGTHVQASGGLDLNRATLEDLRRLPGIGPTLAAEIVSARERRGRFAAADDLRAVPGMGPKKYERIRDLVTVEALPMPPHPPLSPGGGEGAKIPSGERE